MRPARDDVDAGFIRYFLTSDLFQQQAVASAAGSVLKHFGPSHLREMAFPVPPPQEQYAIAEVLGSLDDKIDLNHRMNRALERMVRAIFKAWFIDFEPVKAKADGATSFSGMPQEVFDALPDKLIKTEHGLAPEGWSYVPIGDLVNVVGGGTPSTKNADFWENGDNPFCTPKDMSKLNAPVLLDTERYITQAGVDKISSGQLPLGTVILSSRAPIGYLALAATPVSVNQGIIAMQTGHVPNTYVLLWTEANMEIIKSRAGGSTFAEISKRNFRPIPALCPDDLTLRAFGNLTEPLFELMTANERESHALERTRDTLLPRLISGDLRIDIAQREGGC
jgi:type I restriction enzyme S subunit